MQPAQASGTGGSSGGNRQLKRWGPIVGVARRGRRRHRRDRRDQRWWRRRQARHDGHDQRRPTSDQAVDDRARGDDTDARPQHPAAPRRTRPPRRPRPRSPTRSRSSRPRSRASSTRSTGATAVTPTTGQVAVPDYFAHRAWRRSPATTAAPPTPASPPTRSPSSTTRARRPIRSSPTSPMPSRSTTPTSEQFDDDGAHHRLLRGVLRDVRPHGQPGHLRGHAVAPTDDVAARADAARIAEEYKPFVVFGGPGADQCLRRRAGGPRDHVHRLHPGPADAVLRRSRPVRVELGRQRGPEADPRGRVHHQAARRQERRARRRRVRRPAAEVRLCCTSRAAARRRSWPTSTRPTMEAAGAPFAEVIAYAARPRPRSRQPRRRSSRR